jgi:hypothetical protein
MTKLGERRIENTGYKVGSSVGGMATGERGGHVILDDPHNAIKLNRSEETPAPWRERALLESN